VTREVDTQEVHKRKGGRRMVDINPYGLLFVASCCIGVVGVIVLVVLLYIAFVPKRSREDR